MEIEIKLAYNYVKEIKELFSEYTNMLVENDQNFKVKITSGSERMLYSLLPSCGCLPSS